MRNICVVTGSRAEYGLLKPLMQLLKEAPEVNFQLVATGTHLAPEFGYTASVMEEDGFVISDKIETLLSSDTNLAMAKAVALGVIGFSELFAKKKPDCIVVLGDRFEIFAAVQAAYCLKVPVAHLHGGEVTSGALDDGFRHAISKLSHLHFVSHEDYKKRLIRMGELPQNITICGALGLDGIVQKQRQTRAAFLKKLGMQQDRNYFLITYHPTTLDPLSVDIALDHLIEAISSFNAFQYLITYANADPLGRKINHRWEAFLKKNKERVRLVKNLGADYFNAVLYSSLVIGNSSSAILEVPYLERPTINIGSRQDGRIFPTSVIQSSQNKEDIIKAIVLALSATWQTKNVANCEKIYGTPGTVAQKIVDVLLRVDLENIIYKKFWDGAA